jgi:hypothetical protein
MMVVLGLRLLGCVVAAAAGGGGQSFGTALKGIHLPHGRERVLYSRACAPHEAPCAMSHFWCGGTFPHYLDTRLRYYVDGEQQRPLVIPLGLAHGMGNDFEQFNVPYSAGSLFGRSSTGLHGWAGSGFFNTYMIPFSSHINVTITLGGPPTGADYFWTILRGRTRAPMLLPGGSAPEPLPRTARLRSYEEAANRSVVPYQSVALFNASSAATSGAVLMTTLAVRAAKGDYAFLEGELRAVPANSSEPEWKLSSGTEDYFLGSFYFDQGPYFLPLAGVTALCPQPPCADAPTRPNASSFGCPEDPPGVTFSAYRVHGSGDPLLFDGGMAVTWRNGEPGHGGGQHLNVTVSTYALVYEWEVER